jgi:hypothetical protein
LLRRSIVDDRRPGLQYPGHSTIDELDLDVARPDQNPDQALTMAEG